MNPEDLLWLGRAELGWEPASLPFLALKDTFVSGDDSDRRLMVRYYHCSADDTVWAKILSGERAQGPPGHVHGGGQSALMDEAMGGAAWMAGHPVVAAHLEFTFTNMLPIGEPALIHAEVTSVEGRKVHTRAVLTDRTGEREFSRGKGLFITLEKDQLDRLPKAAAEIVAQAARRPR
ncbi:PaaI family thioesterase [bacterium CG17_big_fil_post_rev_8_21_14_2_50_64_8]|nr:MAG: PaaI family thioesterase [bacterium CG17_big_fil_post_rev_8_21_14_2_50_64_8]PJA75806.1 MAG: PaaI family thioesterase [bacterium CG_4_9_14_3_um_filter_65_15]